MSEIQKPFIPILDVIFLIVGIFYAVSQRGTLMGWLFALFVCFEVFAIIRYMKNA